MRSEKVIVTVYDQCNCNMGTTCTKCHGKGWIKREEEIEIKSRNSPHKVEEKVEKSHDKLEEIRKKNKQYYDRINNHE